MVLATLIGVHIVFVHAAAWFPHVVNNLTWYDLVSGWIPCALGFSFLSGFWHQHNCHVRRCPRLQFHPHPQHGHPVCKRHFKDDVEKLEDH